MSSKSKATEKKVKKKKETKEVKTSAKAPLDSAEWREAELTVAKWEAEMDQTGIMGELIPLFRAALDQTRQGYSKKTVKKRKTSRMSGYTMFVKQEGKGWQGDPSITDGKERNLDRIRKLGARWKKLTREEKEEWNAKAQVFNSSTATMVNSKSLQIKIPS